MSEFCSKLLDNLDKHKTLIIGILFVIFAICWTRSSVERMRENFRPKYKWEHFSDGKEQDESDLDFDQDGDSIEEPATPDLAIPTIDEMSDKCAGNQLCEETVSEMDTLLKPIKKVAECMEDNQCRDTLMQIGDEVSASLQSIANRTPVMPNSAGPMAEYNSGDASPPLIAELNASDAHEHGKPAPQQSGIVSYFGANNCPRICRNMIDDYVSKQDKGIQLAYNGINNTTIPSDCEQCNSYFNQKLNSKFGQKGTSDNLQ